LLFRLNSLFSISNSHADKPSGCDYSGLGRYYGVKGDNINVLKTSNVKPPLNLMRYLDGPTPFSFPYIYAYTLRKFHPS
jgi:hypothetical protein